MEKITKNSLKNSIAINPLKDVIEDLRTLFSTYKEEHGEAGIIEYEDRLILISRKLKKVQQDQHSFVIDNESANLGRSRISASIMDLINSIPNAVFDGKKIETISSTKDQYFDNIIDDEVEEYPIEENKYEAIASAQPTSTFEIKEKVSDQKQAPNSKGFTRLMTLLIVIVGIVPPIYSYSSQNTDVQDNWEIGALIVACIISFLVGMRTLSYLQCLKISAIFSVLFGLVATYVDNNVELRPELWIVIIGAALLISIPGFIFIFIKRKIGRR